MPPKKDDKLKCYTLKAKGDGHKYVTCDDNKKAPVKKVKLKLKLKPKPVVKKELPDDVLKELKTISAEVLAELSETSPLAKEIYDSFMAYQKGVTNYHHISEQAYLEARDL